MRILSSILFALIIAAINRMESSEAINASDLSTRFANTWPMIAALGVDQTDVLINGVLKEDVGPGAWGFQLLDVIHKGSALRAYTEGRAVRFIQLPKVDGYCYYSLGSKGADAQRMSAYTFRSEKLNGLVVQSVFDSKEYDEINTASIIMLEKEFALDKINGLFILRDMNGLSMISDGKVKEILLKNKIKVFKTGTHAYAVPIKDLLTSSGEKINNSKSILMSGFVDGVHVDNILRYRFSKINNGKAQISFSLPKEMKKSEIVFARIAVGYNSTVTSSGVYGTDEDGLSTMEMEIDVNELISESKKASSFVAMVADKKEQSNVCELVIHLAPCLGVK